LLKVSILPFKSIGDLLQPSQPRSLQKGPKGIIQLAITSWKYTVIAFIALTLLVGRQEKHIRPSLKISDEMLP